jgi:transglutaminase-like putative cysteine protease
MLGGERDYTIQVGDGLQGVKDTLYIMSRLTREYKKSPRVITLARMLTSRVMPKDWYGEIVALHQYVRDSVRYVQDVDGVETLATPDRTIEMAAGDCDDKSLLLAALLGAIGHPSRFVAVGETPGSLTHVYVETKLGDNWLPLETTELVVPGWAPPNMVSRFVVNN